MKIIIRPRVFEWYPKLLSYGFVPDEFFTSGGHISRSIDDIVVFQHESEEQLRIILNNDSIFNELIVTIIDDSFVVNLPPANLAETTSPVTDADTVPGFDETEDELGDSGDNRIIEVNPDYRLPKKEEESNYAIKIAQCLNNSTTSEARDLTSLMNRFHALTNELIKIKRLIDSKGKVLDCDPDVKKIIESIIYLKKHPKIDDVFLSPEFNINIVTKVIKVEVEHVIRILGKMLITLPLKLFVGSNPDLSGIRIINLTHTISYNSTLYQAPHVYENGRSCFGGATCDLIINAIAARDVALTFSAILQFLELPNIEDEAGECALLLPEANK